MRSRSLNALSDNLALMPDAPAAPRACAPSPARPDADYDELVVFHGIERERLVLIHPGSHGATPAWPVERYAEVADQLGADGWQIAIVGDALEPERTGAVLGAMQTAALFLAGTMSPETLMRLIGDARLVLSDDAATPSPVAAARALGTPTRRVKPSQSKRAPRSRARTARTRATPSRCTPRRCTTRHSAGRRLPYPMSARP
jgi:ADP-heptose:LPS heptosyltransferase